MSIQSSINRMVYYAGAYKIASKRNEYWGAKANNAQKVEQQPKKPTKPSQGSKDLLMRKKALQSAMNEIEARVTQREAYTHIRNGGMF